MNFKVGQVWETRDGQRMTIIDVGHSDIFPIVAEGAKNKIAYTSHGRFYRCNKHNPSDLVKLITDVDETQNTKQQEEITMANSLKSFFNKHEDVLMTLGLVLLVDHFILDGSLRDKIKQMTESILDRIKLPGVSDEQ